MRLLTALTFASGALALATGPVQRPADQQTVQGDALLNPENAVLAIPEITPRDETVSSSEVGKRNPGTEATVRMPTAPGPGAGPLTIAGVTIIFVMGKRWIQRQGEEVLEHFVKHVLFRNGNRARMFVQATANGINFFTMRMAQNVQTYDQDPPTGADFFKLVVRPVNDEL
ncbi:hypothetical protein E4U35_000693 [Claviceps purpurea]|nr:hypothetical protein E4U38_000566 [Claviceps purpurea]KAG6147613.1 hypothetical protein E4U11_000863 [Claviceps purpurea]KAG6147639.1 hypothetical protein E4U37_007884 [Claviceps purpurea]KAG6170781.1 hypothetical protein E4U51_000595 [Claviceps purpurea]KAG6196855.1 hypothetical protein E4U10_000613 [Claviceps purpurea]